MVKILDGFPLHPLLPSLIVMELLIPPADWLPLALITRDSGGAAHCWRVGRIATGSAIFIEAWALRIACAMALEMNFAELIFESDCLEPVKAVTDGKGACPWEVDTMVEDIKEWAKCRR